MKIAAFISFITLVIVCLGLWLVCWLDSTSIAYAYPFRPFGGPSWLVMHPTWLPIIPASWLPFLVVLLKRKELTSASVLIFHSTIFCAICVLFILIALAGIAPWLPQDGRLAPPPNQSP